MDRDNEVTRTLLEATLALLVCGLAITAKKEFSKRFLVHLKREDQLQAMAANHSDHSTEYPATVVHPINIQPWPYVDISSASPLLSCHSMTCPRPIIRANRTIPLSFPTANIAEFISPSATASAPPELASLPIAVIVWFFVALVTAVVYTAYTIQKCSGLDGLDSADISNLQFSLIMTTHSAGGALGTERDEQSEEIGALRNDIQALEARLATKEEQLHNYVQSLESANATVARLESRLEEEADQIKVHEGSIQAARETIKVLNSRLEAQSADHGLRLSQMAVQLSDHKAQLASKDDQLAISAAEFQRLQRRQLEGSERRRDRIAESDWR